MANDGVALLPHVIFVASPLRTISDNRASPPPDDMCIAPELVTFANIDEHHISIISIAISSVYGITTHRDFQIEAINCCASNNNAFIVIIRRTSDGKSLFLLPVALLRNGVMIILVPLHGLGSDQMEKANLASTSTLVNQHCVNTSKYSPSKRRRK